MNTLAHLPDHVTVYEVGPRDGLQNQPEIVPTEVKIRFVDLLQEAGLPYVEVTAFVRPGVIPQLADAEEVMLGVRRDRSRLTALVPNLQGLERAVGLGLHGIGLFTAASETFSRRNTNASIAETFARFGPVVAASQQLRLWVRGYISTAFGCPYEGDVSVESVVAISRRLDELGADQIVISDTIGVAPPRQVADVVATVADVVPRERLALHFHDTRGTALANVLAGLEMGVTTFDAAAGGLGGCPYAPGATGNLATEDLLYMLHGMGIETGVALDGVVRATEYLARATGIEPVSRYFQAAMA